jgi:hypothetical protein
MKLKPILKMNTLSKLYEQDFYAWTLRTTELLRQRHFDELDIEHLAEELETMSRRDRHELVSRLKILLAHLLKWQFQSHHRSNSWRNSIVEQRLRINDLLQFSPSLKPFLIEAATIAYPDAVKLAVKETGLPQQTFPENCPYNPSQFLEDDFLPE